MTAQFHRILEKQSGKKLQLTINDNRSTMLSIRWEPNCTRLSLHRMFLHAPQNIMDSLACYIRGDRRQITPELKCFIEENRKQLDYSHLLTHQTLFSQGSVYNLQTIYDRLNQEYFDPRLNLAITWFGKSFQRNKSRISLGLYHDALKLIKIHKILDNPLFPKYVVEHIIHHEMVHHICPAYCDAKGVSHVHNKQFKIKEAQYRYYELANQWIKEHRQYLFTQF